MPPVATIENYSTFYLANAYGDAGMGGGEVHHLEDQILALFLSQDSHTRSCLGRTGMGTMCHVNIHLVSGEGITLNHCGVQMTGIWKWEPRSLKEDFPPRKGG